MEKSALFENIVAFGKVGHGKSTFLNAVLGKKYFGARRSRKSVTKDVNCTEMPFHDLKLRLFDTPGTEGEDFSTEKFLHQLQIQVGSNNKIHAVFHIIKATDMRVSDDMALRLKTLESIIKNFSVAIVITVFTHCDHIEEEDRAEFEAEREDFVEEIINRAGAPGDIGRHICFSEKTGMTEDLKATLKSCLRETIDARELADQVNYSIFDSIPAGMDRKEYSIRCQKMVADSIGYLKTINTDRDEEMKEEDLSAKVSAILDYSVRMFEEDDQFMDSFMSDAKNILFKLRLKKDGKPDMRCAVNRRAAGIPKGKNLDGSDDMRFKINRAKLIEDDKQKPKI
mmetsp:Transcript_27857/g.31991  ORF Transcript_27857/g.31991 Transcript_27857/m.31991 type:complete len:340 (-) Transcript_27857:131-1150(-)|eukprot:CAMPEP_0115007766 /NCGR_PEP_ID=MMETSP0216-20121206/21430_1 /TAXON_ID=223996 /ORGANISM="Protocruzia adherens, Strain Boccale" /LENGTH=339 /DNA_ID=CAMNT_0002374881 /DNA_START=197 /DNA_END=1216 /DNA_ORIENTATION=-